jgi:NAD(P)H-flavin reductase
MRTLAPLGRRLAEISAYRRVGAYDILVCADPDGPAPDPGQFYMLAAAERWGGGSDERPFLPRAFSVMRYREGGGEAASNGGVLTSPAGGGEAAAMGGRLEFMLEAVGPGTMRLGELREGDGLWISGPFGIGFAPPREGRRPLLVGGGVGTAPLAIWQDALGSPRGLARVDELAQGARSSAGSREPAMALLGFRDGDHAAGASLLDRARVATDDGSVGHQGPVTDLLLAELGQDPHVEVYACGPPGMLEAIRAICAQHAIPAQLALESGMACGYGACFGCVVPTKHGYVRLCVDGPVLQADELEHIGAH